MSWEVASFCIFEPLKWKDSEGYIVDKDKKSLQLLPNGSIPFGEHSEIQIKPTALGGINFVKSNGVENLLGRYFLECTNSAGEIFYTATFGKDALTNLREHPIEFGQEPITSITIYLGIPSKSNHPDALRYNPQSNSFIEGVQESIASRR